jgi:hypothetical protein
VLQLAKRDGAFARRLGGEKRRHRVNDALVNPVWFHLSRLWHFWARELSCGARLGGAEAI